MHTVDEALSIIGTHAEALRPRDVPLCEAMGLKLAGGVVMDVDAPPFDRAMVDGYAVRAGDVTAGTELKIVGRVDAGSAAEVRMGPGECAAINTGAPVPAGADAVVMVEDTAEAGAGVRIYKGISAGSGIQRRGSDARAGEVVLPAGMILTPAGLAVAAAAGKEFVEVENPRPTVAVLVTGDELVPIEHVPGPAQIRNSNQTLLKTLVGQVGAVALDLGAVRDEEFALQLALARGLTEADVLVVTGGMSMGTKDLVPRILAELGVVSHVEKLRMRPGKPFVFGTVSEAGRKRYVAGLPGNPVSAFVCFMRLVAPLLAKLSASVRAPAMGRAVAGGDLAANTEREFYQPCALEERGGEVVATPLKWRGSADLFTLARADGLIVHPIGCAARSKGAAVDILRLRT